MIAQDNHPSLRIAQTTLGAIPPQTKTRCLEPQSLLTDVNSTVPKRLPTNLCILRYHYKGPPGNQPRRAFSREIIPENDMPVPITQVSRTLGRICGWCLSNLEMQRFCYIAEMLYLGRQQEPLIEEFWSAWPQGPIQRDLYEKLQVFGARPVKDILRVPLLDEGSAKHKATLDAWNLLKELTPGQQIALTHRRDGPWYSCYRPGFKSFHVSKADMFREYRILVNDPIPSAA